MLITMALLSACATPTAAPTARDAEPVTSIYLVSHGWHTGIVIRRSDIPPALWPESRDFPTAESLEVGWGDRDYYQAPEPGLWTGVKALLLPTPSVLHVVGLHESVVDAFPRSEIVELGLPRAGIERLVNFVHDAHDRAGSATVPALGPGLYGDSRFYPARESFHLLRNCNAWTARALRTAGLPFASTITVGGIMTQARALGRSLAPGQRRKE